MKKLFKILFLSFMTGSSLIAMNAQEGMLALRNARDAAREGLDLYAIIGVDANVSQATLNSIARHKVRQIHPDKGGNVDEFQRFNHAYSILKDSVIRREYDRARALIGGRRFVWNERRKKFVNTLRAYKNAALVAATAAVASTVAMTSQVVNCRDVAQAICNGQAVAPRALHLCAEYVPSSVNCLMRMF